MKEQSQSPATRRESQTSDASRRQQADEASQRKQANLGQNEAEQQKKSEAELKRMGERPRNKGP